MGPRAVLVLGLLTVAVEVAGQEVLYYHHDATGNRVAMTDETGQVVWQADVRPFGEGIPSPASRLLRFLGQEREAGTTAEGGLYMLGARYLDPFLGRFISPDPLPLDKVQRESSQRFNLYSYALNNPYRFHDATGFEPELQEQRPTIETSTSSKSIGKDKNLETAWSPETFSKPMVTATTINETLEGLLNAQKRNDSEVREMAHFYQSDAGRELLKEPSVRRSFNSQISYHLKIAEALDRGIKHWQDRRANLITTPPRFVITTPPRFVREPPVP